MNDSKLNMGKTCWLLVLVVSFSGSCGKTEDSDSDEVRNPSQAVATGESEANGDSSAGNPDAVDSLTGATESLGDDTVEPTAGQAESAASGASATPSAHAEVPTRPSNTASNLPTTSTSAATSSAATATGTGEATSASNAMTSASTTVSDAGAGPMATGGSSNSAGADAATPMPTDLPVAVCTDELGGIASAADFSINTDSGHYDRHLLLMRRGDLIRRIMQYVTTGDADHQHDVYLQDAEMDAILNGESITVTTQGPPSNAATGHTHTIHVTPCPEAMGL